MTAASRWGEPWLVSEGPEGLVVDKPAGVPTRRVARHGQDGMVEWVRRQRPDRSLVPDGTLDAAERGRLVLAEEGARVEGAATHPVPVVDGDPWEVALEARLTLLDPADTDAFVWVDRHHDGLPDVRIERLGPVALALDYRDNAAPLPGPWIAGLLGTPGVRAVYQQHRPRRGAGRPARLVAGDAPPRFDVRELGIRYRIDLDASATSSGLFVDQRETRRELLSTPMAGRTVLNTFAHTGAFSVAAALAGAETLTLDLSKHYLDWARENLELNGIDPGDHDFVYGDAMDWMSRFAKRGRRFDLVIADPPTSSTARKGSKRWTVGRDLHELVRLSVELTAPGGRTYVSTNFRKLRWSAFLDHVDPGVSAAGRTGRVVTRTRPLDHRSASDDPPYLKGAWIRLDP